MNNSFFTNYSLFQLKSNKEITKKVAHDKKKVKKKLFKLSYSAQKLQFRTILFPGMYKLCTHYAKVQKYEQGKIGVQFFDMWC